MRKFKMFFEFKKEEKWLNEMAASGYELVDKSFGYRFREAGPETANFKIDYRVFKKETDFEDYTALYEDTGWKHMVGSKNSGFQYFKKDSEKATEDIFSDVDSKAGRYKRLSEMYLSLAMCYLPIFVALIATDAINVSAFFHPRLLYFTPGLWEKTGTSFWSAFLFETPFALFRGFSWLFLVFFIASFLLFSAKASYQYRLTKKM